MEWGEVLPTCGTSLGLELIARGRREEVLRAGSWLDSSEREVDGVVPRAGSPREEGGRLSLAMAFGPEARLTMESLDDCDCWE